MNLKKTIFWIFLFLVIFLTRFYALTKVPVGLTIDEVSIGYNAYSILKTGRDEWGHFLPTSFRSVGDYKPPTLIYVTIPFVKLLGLTEITTRLPVALFSTFTVLFFWLLLVRHIIDKKYDWVSYLATLIFALSPWHIVYSRSGFEAILALFFILVNIYFAFEYRKSGTLKHLFLMVMFAYLSAITYHSARLFSPLFNFIFLISEYDRQKGNLARWLHSEKLKFFLTAASLLAVTAFFLKSYIFGPGGYRAAMTFLAQDFDYARVLLAGLETHPFSWFGSKFVLIFFWFKRFLEYFSSNFYLSTGLNLTITGHQGQGVIYAIEYPLLIIGALSLIFKGKNLQIFSSPKSMRLMMIFWIFLGFLPASLTNNTQHSLRSLNLVPAISILISLGIVMVFSRASSFGIKTKHVLLSTIVLGYILGIVRFVDYFSLHYSIELSEHRQYGWKEMALFARDHYTEYDQVYVDHRFGTAGPYTYGVPHLYFLFYSAYDPHKYNTDPRRLEYNSDYENFIFTGIDWRQLDHSQNNLYIASPWSYPVETLQEKDKIRNTTYFLNGKAGLYAITDK